MECESPGMDEHVHVLAQGEPIRWSPRAAVIYVKIILRRILSAKYGTAGGVL
jgi:hypothetical protein